MRRNMLIYNFFIYNFLFIIGFNLNEKWYLKIKILDRYAWKN